MKRIVGILTTLVILTLGPAAWAGSVSNQEAVAGLKETLSRGATAAVGQLGKPDGFWGNDKLRIPLPDSLQKGESLLRGLGMGKQADELKETMNRAAESAVAEAKPLLVNAVKQMTVKDAQAILTGGDDGATQYFRRTTATPLTAKFRPIVAKATAKVQLADQYNRLAGKAAKLYLLESQDANLDDYVTRKALDGLYSVIAEQEKTIRHDPVGTGSKLLEKVFGGLLK